ncbi:MAG: TonB-dependent receptor [Spongiibacteraceae bacterium]|nr:TonB-dependent receptor [Spongiibacteraceae bacterium]
MSIDIVASLDTDWFNGVTSWSLAYNYTRTKVENFNPETVDAARILQIEQTTPDTRVNLTALHQMNQLRVTGRLSYYGDFWDHEAGGTFDDALTADLELAYDLDDNATIMIGGRNITNEKGCTLDDCGSYPSTDLGNQYSQFSPFGFSGAFWYTRLQYRF